MLVLSRKVQEKIRIGDDVTLTINRISGNRVTIGIEAPGHVRILRGELEEAADEFRGESDAGVDNLKLSGSAASRSA